MDSSPPGRGSAKLPPAAGVKRPAPSLLPALEFQPSKKRQARTSNDNEYPTPVPSSSIGQFNSSPPQLPAVRAVRPALKRTQSTISERAPLADVPRITLPANGEPVTIGRSSKASMHSISSSNSLISRKHVTARYIPTLAPPMPNRVELVCNGYNGMRVHCRARAWDIAMEEKFVTPEEDVPIMLDIQDSRVTILWPPRERQQSISADSDYTWNENSSPLQGIETLPPRMGSSPRRRTFHVGSPESPSPAGNLNFPTSSTFLPSDLGHGQNPIAIYEDEDAASDYRQDQQSPNPASETHESAKDRVEGQASSGLSSPASDFSEHNEENDPIIHSFGPQGDNILPRLASLPTSASSERQPLGEKSAAECDTTSEEVEKFDHMSLTNHVLNQLAFARTQSTPLSTLFTNLPAELKEHGGSALANEQQTKAQLKVILSSTLCVGEISREGKDAAGKPLENEFYYIPEKDTDQDRKATVVQGLGKPSLRSCRKQHKQYYWRKPKN